MIKKFLLILVVTTGILNGQNTPIKITIYSNDSVTTSRVEDIKHTENVNGYKNLIKWNYCLLGRGVLLFNYERHLSNRFTFEMGLGLTYSDFVFTSVYELGNYTRSSTTVSPNSSGGTTSKSLMPNPFENSQKAIGFGIETSPKIYFEKDEFQGLYFSPYFSYRKYNYTTTVDESTGASFSLTHRSFALYYNFLDIGIKAGYQYYFAYYDHLYYDFYLGFAYRNAHINTLQVTETQNNFTNNTLSYSEYLQSLGLIHVMLGAKIGFAF